MPTTAPDAARRPFGEANACGAQLLDHVAIVRLGKEVGEGFREHGADIMDVKQSCFVGIHQGVEAAEMRGEIFRRRFADVPYAERKNKSGERRVLTLFDRSTYIPCALVRHPFKLRQL